MHGTGVLERIVDGIEVEIDGRNATINAGVAQESSDGGHDEIIYTNPAELLQRGVLPSLSLIRFAKVKSFIDGVYAVVEERISEGGHRLSRADLLRGLSEVVKGDAKSYIERALGGDVGEDPSMRLPQGFYDWNEPLRAVWKQIRVLGENPSFFVEGTGEGFDDGVMKSIARTISESPELKQAYESLLELYSKTTGKLGEGGLFPCAVLPDQEFFKKASHERQSDLEEGLGKLLVEAVKSKEVSFVPDKDSGLYLRQMHEIVPLIMRDSEEFSRFMVDDKYASILENEFISQWAGTRHTHVGHARFGEMMIGCSHIPERSLKISPSLSVEPFSTCYDRMGKSLAFLERTLREYLPEVLDRKRLMHDGSRAGEKIGKEFEEVAQLLRGLSCLSRDSIHFPYQDKNPDAAIKAALEWIDNMGRDPDINRNTAIFVPIIRTTDGTRQVGYINAGFKLVKVHVSYRDLPEVKVTGGGVGGFGRRYEFEGADYQLPVFVHREVRIPYYRPVNDRMLRGMLPESFDERELGRVVKELEKVA